MKITVNLLTKTKILRNVKVWNGIRLFLNTKILNSLPIVLNVVNFSRLHIFCSKDRLINIFIR